MMPEPTDDEPALSPEIEKLVSAGWVAADGSITAKGRAALRRGLGGHKHDKTLPINSVLARAKPSVKKKGKRRG